MLELQLPRVGVEHEELVWPMLAPSPALVPSVAIVSVIHVHTTQWGHLVLRLVGWGGGIKTKSGAIGDNGDLYGIGWIRLDFGDLYGYGGLCRNYVGMRKIMLAYEEYEIMSDYVGLRISNYMVICWTTRDYMSSYAGNMWHYVKSLSTVYTTEGDANGILSAMELHACLHVRVELHACLHVRVDVLGENSVQWI